MLIHSNKHSINSLTYLQWSQIQICWQGGLQASHWHANPCLFLAQEYPRTLYHSRVSHPGGDTPWGGYTAMSGCLNVHVYMYMSALSREWIPLIQISNMLSDKFRWSECTLIIVSSSKCHALRCQRCKNLIWTFISIWDSHKSRSFSSNHLLTFRDFVCTISYTMHDYDCVWRACDAKPTGMCAIII